LPKALIVSPATSSARTTISLIGELTIDQLVNLEERVDELERVFTGGGYQGIGVYPTMVMQTSDLNWMAEVVAHEVHNFLTMRPLGLNYESARAAHDE
jgi:hypothetical protein